MNTHMSTGAGHTQERVTQPGRGVSAARRPTVSDLSVLKKSVSQGVLPRHSTGVSAHSVAHTQTTEGDRMGSCVGSAYIKTFKPRNSEPKVGLPAEERGME